MTHRRVLGTFVFALATVAALLGATSAVAAGGAPVSHRIGGIDGVVGCMTPTVCVVGGYNSHSVANLITVHAGVPTRIVDVPKTQGVYQISCPNPSGCVALLRTSNDIGVRFATLNAAGAVTRDVLVPLPVGVILGSLACTTMTSCVVAGTDVFKTPAPYEIGTWAAGKLTLHGVNVPARTTDTLLNNLACFRTFCDAVGYVQRSNVTTGVSIAITNAHHFALHTLGSDLPYGVSCISTALCYADGFRQSGGVVLTLKSGVLTSSAGTSPDLYGIACVKTSCTAVGKQLAPSGSKSFYWGDVIPVIGGKPGTTATVPQTEGLESVARVGGDYTGIGLWQASGSDAVTNG